MKKLLALLIGLPLLVLAVMPAVVGSVINNPEPLAQLKLRLGQPEMTLTLDRGWFRTTGLVTVKNPIIGERRHEGVSFTAPVRIQHGPLLWTDSGLALGLAYAVAEPRLDAEVDDAVFTALLSSATAPRVTLLINLQRDATLHWVNDTVYYNNGEVLLTAENFSLLATVTPARTADIFLHADQIRGTSRSFGSVEADHPALALQGRDPNGTLLPNALQISLPHLHIDAEEQLTLNGIRIDYAAREEPGTNTVTIDQHVVLEQLESRAPLTALRMDSVTRNIDVDLFRQLRALVNDARGSTVQSPEDILLQLRRNPFSQHADATLTLWQGDHQFAIDLNWPGISTLANVDELTTSRVLRTLDASITIRADVEAIERSFVAIMARNYAAQGMLPVDNGQYVLDMNLQGGTLNVNGQSIVLEPFLNLLNQMNR